MTTITATATATATEHPVPTVADQAPTLLSALAGYVSSRTIAMGLHSGLIPTLAKGGRTPDDLAEELGYDPFYVAVWCRSAFAAGVCDRDGSTYRLAPHMATLLLDGDSPAYVGGVFTVMERPEMFDHFQARLATGERMWWDDTSPEWIAAVARTGTPFYTRLVPGGLERVPGLAQALERGGRVVDSACGSGVGIVRLAQAYPASHIVGVDGDRESLEQARRRIADAGVEDRVTLIHSPLEQMRLDEPATLVINNISMHECRDIDRVTENVKAALEPGGCFVISDFPFPDTDEGLRSAPGRIMSGIQFFEAQIDDQLVPRATYDALLARHGFVDGNSFVLTPMHAVTYGWAPGR